MADDCYYYHHHPCKNYYISNQISGLSGFDIRKTFKHFSFQNGNAGPYFWDLLMQGCKTEKWQPFPKSSTVVQGRTSLSLGKEVVLLDYLWLEGRGGLEETGSNTALMDLFSHSLTGSLCHLRPRGFPPWPPAATPEGCWFPSVPCHVCQCCADVLDIQKCLQWHEKPVLRQLNSATLIGFSFRFRQSSRFSY